MTHVRLAKGIVAARHLVELVDDEDIKPADFPRVATDDVDLRGPSKTEHVDASGARFGKAITPPADWSAVMASARTLAAPDVGALTSAF